MATDIFVNLPVRDLPASKRFFGKLGFTFNAQFTDDTAAALVTLASAIGSVANSLNFSCVSNMK